jgi:hypothetical protein
MTILGVVLACVLAMIALLHVYWGFGGVWPGHDEKSCARAIAGFRGIERMPSPAASFAVAFALLVAAFIAAALGGAVAPIVPPVPLALAGAGAAALFLARGMAGYTSAWRRIAPEMPFARYDRRYYSPLCLALGAGFATLLLQGSNA